MTSVPQPTVPATSTPASKPRLQLEHVDGIRGLLTVAILLAHVRTTLTYIPLKAMHTSLFAASTLWMWPAFFSVGLFVAMSGYVLMLPVARSSNGWYRDGVLDYLRRRARRMLPPYYLALVIGLIWARYERVHEAVMYPFARSAPSIISHVTLVHNLLDRYRFSIDAPNWTVSSEWQLYVLFPLVLLPIWRRFGVLALLGSSAILSALTFAVGPDAVHFHGWFIFVFACGMAGAAIQFYNRDLESKLRAVMPWGRIAGALFLLFFVALTVDLTVHERLRYLYIPDWKRFCIYETLVGMGCVALIIRCSDTTRTNYVSRLTQRVLNFKGFVFIGTYSYSHYLVHYFILMSLRWYTVHLGFTDAGVVCFMYGVAIPTSLVCGYLYYQMAERWFLPSHIQAKKAVPISP